MDISLRVVGEDGVEREVAGHRRPGWTSMPDPCPGCGARTFRHFQARAGRYGCRNGILQHRSEYWDGQRALLTRCLHCDLVLYKHPAVDLLFDEAGSGGGTVVDR
ncbi:MAG: hypothetical protein V5A43_03910 [Haloarculaceae archaeon]